MYNPYQAPGQYGAPPGGYGAPPGMGLPPGMAPPPGVAPGTTGPPGMHLQDADPQGRPTGGMGGFPANFQPPANMPNINFSAPVIRLGTSAPAKSDLLGGRDERGGGRRAGLGSTTDGGRGTGGGRGDDGSAVRSALQQVQPQTKEEIIKTVFVGGITEGCGGDEGVERILRAAGGLRRWVRAVDAEEKVCKFGFAEFEDAEGLATAIEVLKNVEVPVERQTVKDGAAKEDDLKKEDDDAEDDKIVKTSMLLVVADENSAAYIEQWEEQQGGIDEDSKQMRLDQAREALQAVLKDLTYPSSPIAMDELSSLDYNGDVKMSNGTITDINGEIVTIPISADDELSDIPAEMREIVAKEIAAFRDRSVRRDLERLKREEEIEQQERNRMTNGRSSRLGSPPPSAPSGPSGGANGIPVGPRDRSGLNAPSGPKAFGAQIPRDYQKGVAFVNGTGSIFAASAFDGEDSDASDEELEKRRKAKSFAEAEKLYLDQERRWLNRERSRTAAVEREKHRDAEEDDRLNEEKEAMARRLREWDDDRETDRKIEEYYADRSMWIRNRASFRQREVDVDNGDREVEMRQTGQQARIRQRADHMADDFLNRQEINADVEMRDADRRDERRTEPAAARFQMKLGAKAQEARDRKVEKEKRTVAEVEGLLEDEEEVDNSSKRTLIPIQFDKNDTAAMTDDERKEAAKQLAGEIPTDKGELWRWDVKWEFVDESVIEERLKPFVQKKIVEYLGVQEDMLVDVVVSGLRARKNAADMVRDLEGALEDEAEALVKKLWRMVIFFSESEKRGLSA